MRSNHHNHFKNMNDKDISQCPFFNKNLKKNSQSGCPFQAKEKYRNPGVQSYEDGYNIKPFSVFNSLFPRNLELYNTNLKFQDLPIYIKNSLFYEFDKFRRLQVDQKYQGYEHFREKGNKHFNNNKFQKAISYYEKVFSLMQGLSCFKYVTYEKKENENVFNQLIQDQYLKIELCEPELNLQNDMGNFFKQEYSFMVQLLLNLSASYMKLHNFQIALQAVNDALELSKKNMSFPHFLKAQIIYHNQESSKEQLQKGHDSLRMAIQISQDEKLFNKSQKLLSQLNMDTAIQQYGNYMILYDEKLQMIEKQQNQKYEGDFTYLDFIQDVKEYYFENPTIKDKEIDEFLGQKQRNELEIIQQYKQQFRLLQIKYEQIERNVINKKNKQINDIFTDMQSIVYVQYHIKFYKELQFENEQKLGNFESLMYISNFRVKDQQLKKLNFCFEYIKKEKIKQYFWSNSIIFRYENKC